MVDRSSILAILAIPLGLAILTIALRRVHGPKYWMAALGVIGLPTGIMLWSSRDTEGPISPMHQMMAVIFLFAIPMSTAFATASASALRARPWLLVIIVPLVFLATVLVDMSVGVTLDILQP